MRVRPPALLRHASPWVAAIAAVAGVVLMPLAAASALAADPSTASPIVFGRAQYLVFWESHSTYDGPVTDNVYALFTDPPVDPPFHFVVPDGSGGVFHYNGRLEGGPYKTDAELCAQMIALDIPSLEAWPPSIVGSQVVVDCAAYRNAPSSAPSAGSSTSPAPASAATTAAASPSAGGSTGAGGIATSDIVRLGGAGAGLILATAGAAGVVRGRRPRRNDKPTDQQRDPCASQETEFHTAMARSEGLGDLLQTNRAMQALLDRQIINLANVVIPGSFGLDVAFVLSGQWFSKVGWGFVPKELLARALDGAIKDVVKEAMKQGLDAAGQGALDLDGFQANLLKGAGKAVEGGDKSILKQLIKDALISRQTGATFTGASGSAQQLAARLEIVKKYGDDVAGPIADSLGHVLSMYNAGIGVAELMDKLDILRIKRDAILDQTATLELELEDALKQAGDARELLNRCRFYNSPDWRP